jgi:acetone carboxylase gamma subunit
MWSFVIHDSRLILDTREHMTTYFIHDSRFILDTKRTKYQSRIMYKVCGHLFSCIQYKSRIMYKVCGHVFSCTQYKSRIMYKVCGHLLYMILDWYWIQENTWPHTLYMILDLYWIQREQMTTYFIHDSRFILDTKRTNDHILKYVVICSLCMQYKSRIMYTVCSHLFSLYPV